MRPPWIRAKFPSGKGFTEIREILQEYRLQTVCDAALCPNIGECYNQKTATFLILGGVCTRKCGYCAVTKGTAATLDEEEPYRVATAVRKMGLKYVVITSVTRDDITDGGAGIFAQTIQCVRDFVNDCKVEVLIPDFGGSVDALWTVLDARPDVLNHNIETVRRLYPIVRPGADYERSLQLLRIASEERLLMPTKSGIMLGLGEQWDEITEVLHDIKNTGCEIITLGQYLRPNKNALPAKRYYTPMEFERLQREGEKMGFRCVESGPLVRSSYHAKAQSESILEKKPEIIQKTHN
ncbi:lipoyl synthase [Candidatus Kuenenia stuttgartiensis]|jgi:lipoic acid synthetase|uniref:Lipoyl synthase n=1 Tax=Kuenenia stuttgartiensis TaxID=174633 RepID=A0A2C9CP11_KUEST|nr:MULTISPECIES: lipoyl synthase [Kuenenia]MBZ0191171.1 lipoyl synthase [Candidatus Kuenenia stuttgartiensis]MCL4727141.1 lipoyl synthase [Candidatus Kuenenia stuttgartiensis]MCZ7623308.1 lipoyl synthase [Candidatus Kuenenia sp.]QII11899.1 lipoyl synthase [Candidatus Kuenenia stuttgartiensis]TVM00638.1 MAG: lipoyl synthase [Candidatus Kuenenia stuttgartiensis]